MPELYPYQKEGVKFLITGKKHKLLADDMGLGKTAQLITAADELNAKSIVVITPATIKYHWARQFSKWSTKQRNIFVVLSSKDSLPSWADVIIVNYELLLQRKEGGIYDQLRNRSQNQGLDLVLADEAHYLKNKDAQRTRRVLGKSSFLKNATRIWLATGTPYLNYPIEIFAVSSVLATECIAPYIDYDDFAARFCGGRLNHRQEYIGASNIDDLRERLKPFMLRRTKEEVLHELPDKVETIIEIDASEIEVSVDETPMSTVRKETGLAKVLGACRYIQTILDNEVRKLVVFAHHREVLLRVRDDVAAANGRMGKPVLIIGGMSSDDKQKAVDTFISDENTNVILVQTHTGGQGVDGLQDVCNHVVFVEPDWSPGIMDQAVDRLHRIGQKKTLFIHYLVAKNAGMDGIINDKESKKREVISQLLADDIKKENVSMPTNNEVAVASLQLIAGAMSLIAEAMQKLSGEGALVSVPNEAVQPVQQVEAPAKRGRKPKPETEDDASVVDGTTTPLEKTPVSTTALTLDNVRKSIGTFLLSGIDSGMSDVEAAHTKDENRELISAVLYPKFGVTAMTELKPEQYDDFVAALAKGPNHYANVEQAPKDDLDGL